MSLRGHNQEKKVTVTTHASSIGASTHAKLNSTQLRLVGLGRRHKPHHMSQMRQLGPVGLGHRRGQYTGHRRQKRSITAAANNLFHLLKSPSSHGSKSIGKQEERIAQHREDHRHAGSAAVVPLQHRTSSSRVEPPNLDRTQAVSQTPPQKHNARGSRHIRRWTPRSRRLTKDTARGGLATFAAVLRVADSLIMSPPG